MSKFKKHLKVGALLVVAAAFALNCARSSKTKFAQNMENDAGQAAPTYEQWVSLVGQEKTDQLYSGVGQDNLNLLSYGIGTSNMVQLINGITVGSKLVTLVGNDNINGTGTSIGGVGKTGLGAVVTVYLLKSIDTQMQALISTNLPAGGVAPTDNDTITNMVNVVNGLTAAQIQTHLVDLFGPSGFNLSRSLAEATTLTTANQIVVVDRMARVVAHVDSGVATCTKICTLLTSLTGAEITGKLAPMMTYNMASGMTLANKLVETIETTTNIANLVTVIQGVTTVNITGKMMPIIDQVNDCTKMGYTINNVTSLPTLINLINYVQVPSNMGALINLAENGGTWTNQVSPAETWGVPVKAAPFATAATAATITGDVSGGSLASISVTGGGSNYLPGTSISFAACSVQPIVHLNIQGGIIQNTGNYVVSAGTCAGTASEPATIATAGTTTAMQRLVSVINGITDTAADPDPDQDFYKLLNMIDGLSVTNNGMDKMIRLVQDVNTISDVYDLVNNMAALAGNSCTIGNGNDTMTISGGGGSGATATTYNVTATGPTNSVAYVYVSNGGTGYTSQPTMTVPGCAGVTFTATISGGVITQITANNSMNNLTQVMELMSLANMPKLQQVLDGQRAFDNTNQTLQAPAATAGTYLYKMNVLMTNLSQPLEGPLKVGDLLNGVTNSDKIIDLIWGVTNTTNLSTVINGIFKSSEVPGCSDGSASTFVGPTGAAYGVDTGTCENSGNGYFYGERDTAVTTLVYLVENVASSAKLISMIDNITPANVIALVNHTATYSQHADGTAHVYPRGAVGLDPQAAGKRLAKIVDNTTTIAQLVYVANNVTAMIKMAKLVSFMDIGTVATDGTGKLAVLINAVTGANAYLSTTVPGRGNPSGNATGMGKMVNVIEFISGATTSAAMKQLKDLLDGVTDINKMADLINQTVNSSNIVGLLNGVTDPRYGTSTADLVALMNSLPRGEISKLVSLIGEIGNATGTATATFPGGDHVLIAQLMSAYNGANITTTSGVGVTDMNALLGSLSVTGGQNYTTAPTVGGLGAGGATATATISASLGAVTKVTLTNEGVCSSVPTGATVNGGGTGATVAFVTAPASASNTNFKIKGVYLTNGGSGYAASTVTFTGGTCSTAPAATTQVNGVIGVSVTAGGAGYTDSFTGVTFTGGGGTGAAGTALVAGPINTLTSFYGGAGYTTGDVCPINGAGGDGTATCTVTATSGALTGCSAIAGGNGYIDNQIVTIGGGASVQGIVTAGSLNSMNVVNGGCGYGAAPTVTVRTGANECTTAGTYVANLTSGRVTSITVTTAATGCPANPTIVLGETPYAAHGDGATAIVGSVTGGAVVAVSLSPASDNLAQLLTNTEKQPGTKAITYNAAAPNISAREGMVRMLKHGVNHTSAGYTTYFGVNNVNYPGIGPVHIAQNVLNNLSGAGSVMTVVNMLNSDTTSLTDLVVLIGCGDHVEYGPTTTTDFYEFCFNHSPSLW